MSASDPNVHQPDATAPTEDDRYACPVCGVRLPRLIGEIWTREQMLCTGPNEAEYRRQQRVVHDAR